MRRLTSRLVLLGAMCALCLTSAEAQRRPSGRPARPAAPAKRAAMPAEPRFTVYGGMATGDELDMGFALQGSFRFVPVGWPVALRIDPYFARHSGDMGFTFPGFDPNIDFTLFGVAGHAEYTFRTTGTDVDPFVLGGLGLYHGSVSVDIPGGGSFGGDDTNFGLSLGGGIRFARRWAAEIQFKMIEDFDTAPILIGIRF
jgi:opacity protein-like surface antigen